MMEEPYMTSRQKAIYGGLCTLRPALAAFYKEGLIIKELPFETKSNLLGHLLREIDGGLRDIFAIKRNEEDKINHKESVAESFGFSSDSSFVNEYHNVSSEFHKYAHRSNKDLLTLRDPAEIIERWEKFEDVLYPLLGSFMGNTLQLDVLLQRDKPNKVADNCLEFILENESKRVYFFQRLDKVGWLEPLYKKGIFDGKNNPEPIESLDNQGHYSCPYWYELFYLTRIISQIDDEKKAFWKIITKIIDGIIGYRKDDGTQVRNYRTNDFIVHLISFLPDCYLKDEYFDTVKSIIETDGSFSSTAFQSYFVPRFIKSRDKKRLLRCLDIMFSFRDNGNNYPKYTFLLDVYMIVPYIKKWNSDICDICGIDGLEILLQKFEGVKDEPELAFISSVDETDHQNIYQRDKYSYRLVFSIIDYIMALPTPELHQTVEKLIISKSDTSKRIAFYLIDKQYDKLKDLYWQYPSNPMDESPSYPEIFRLLKNHTEDFSDKEIERTIEWIDTIAIPKGNDITQEHIDYYKKSLAIALEDREHPAISAYLVKINKVCTQEVEFPGYNVHVGSTELPVVNLSSKTIPEIIELYKQAELSKQPLGLDTYNLDASFYKLIIKEQPGKYAENNDDLVDAPISMLRTWVLGLYHLSGQPYVIEKIENVFAVIYRVLQQEKFWVKANEKTLKDNIECSFLSDLLGFICKVDFHKISEAAALKQIDNVLKTIYKNKVFEESNYDWDYRIESILNTLKYKMYNEMILLNFAYAKKMNLPEGSRWNRELKMLIDKSVDSEETNLEFFFALGEQHHSLWYLDGSWMEKHIERLFFCSNEQNRVASFYGFMMFYPLADQKVFFLFLDKGVLEDILDRSDAFDSIIVKSVVFNLLQGYRSKVVDYNKIDLLIKTNERGIYREVIDFGSVCEKKEDDFNFIKSVWAKFIKAHSMNPTEETRYFCSESYRWLEQVITLDDDVFCWLKIAAKESDNNFYNFTELLKPYIFTETEKAGMILFELIKNTGHIFHYELPLLVEEIYKAGLNFLADEICDECARKQEFSLGEVFKRYHS